MERGKSDSKDSKNFNLERNFNLEGESSTTKMQEELTSGIDPIDWII